MSLLRVGAIRRGKLIFLLDLSNFDSAYLRSALGALINLVTLAGICVGLIGLSKQKSNYIMSTMFFLTPIVAFSVKIVSPIIHQMRNLDYGWLEPSTLVKNNLVKVSSKTSDFFV